MRVTLQQTAATLACVCYAVLPAPLVRALVPVVLVLALAWIVILYRAPLLALVYTALVRVCSRVLAWFLRARIWIRRASSTAAPQSVEDASSSSSSSRSSSPALGSPVRPESDELALLRATDPDFYAHLQRLKRRDEAIQHIY